MPDVGAPAQLSAITTMMATSTSTSPTMSTSISTIYPRLARDNFANIAASPVSCGPRGLKGGHDRLYHNNGDGTFTDVTEKLNIDPDSYYGLGVLWLDYDLDGCLDLYVANDSSPSLLYHNDCKGGFTEVGCRPESPTAADGREQAGMGIDSADYDNDGWPDIIKANFSDDTNNLFHNDHNGEFTDRAGPQISARSASRFLDSGLKFLDFDNDGWKDIFVANGHVNPQVDQHSFGVTYAERAVALPQSARWQVRRNRNSVRLSDVPPLCRARCRHGRLLQPGQGRPAGQRARRSPLLLRNQTVGRPLASH